MRRYANMVAHLENSSDPTRLWATMVPLELSAEMTLPDSLPDDEKAAEISLTD